MELCQLHDHYFDSSSPSHFTSHRVRPTQSSFPACYRHCWSQSLRYACKTASVVMRITRCEACSCLIGTSHKDCHRIFKWKFCETPIPHWSKLHAYHAEDTCWLRKNWTKLVLGCRYLQENLWLSWGHGMQKDGCIFIRVSHPRLTNCRSQRVQQG